MPPSSDLKHKAPSHMVAKLYSHVSRTVFILTKNFRAKDDPILTKLLDALQMGDLTEHDKALLNSRVLTTETAAQFTTRLLETSSSAELSSTIGIATSLNSRIAITTTFDTQTTLLPIKKELNSHLYLQHPLIFVLTTPSCPIHFADTSKLTYQ